MATSPRRRRPACWAVEPSTEPCGRVPYARRAVEVHGAGTARAGAVALAAHLGAATSWDATDEGPDAAWRWDLAGWDAVAAGGDRTPTSLVSGLVSVLEQAAGHEPGRRSRHRVRRALSAASTGVSWALAFAGVGAAAAVGAGLYAGYQPVVVRSGSMGSSVPVGALVITRTVDATSVKVGQVVTVRTADGSLLTHRVVEARSTGGAEVQLHLKGDANRAADSTALLARRVAVPVAVVPELGRVASALGSPAGAALLGGGLVATLAVGWVGRERQRAPRPIPVRIG